MRQFKTLWKGMAAALAGGLLLCACSSEEDSLEIPEGKGLVRIGLSADTGFSTQTKAVTESDYENLENYTVQIWKDGSVFSGMSWNYQDMPAFTELKNGTYTLLAFNGDSTKAVYTNDLCFLGSTNFTLDNDTANVTVNCKPNSARINVVFDEKMDTYFSSYTVNISTLAQNGSVYPWTKDTQGPVYFKVGENEAVKVKISLTKTDGTNANVQEKEYTLSPADALKITVAPVVNSGNVGITIDIDETVIDHPVDIEIPSEWV